MHARIGSGSHTIECEGPSCHSALGAGRRLRADRPRRPLLRGGAASQSMVRPPFRVLCEWPLGIGLVIELAACVCLNGGRAEARSRAAARLSPVRGDRCQPRADPIYSHGYRSSSGRGDRSAGGERATARSDARHLVQASRAGLGCRRCSVQREALNRPRTE